MDRGTLHGIATIFAMIAFLAVCYWAYKPSNKRRFDADAQIALDTDPLYQAKQKKTDSGDKK